MCKLSVGPLRGILSGCLWGPFPEGEGRGEIEQGKGIHGMGGMGQGEGGNNWKGLQNPDLLGFSMQSPVLPAQLTWPPNQSSRGAS